MHGIQRERRHSSRHDTGVGVSKVVVRYADGRTLNFLPEAGRANFSEDDMLELKKILTRASSAVEWAELGESSGG